MWKRFLQGLLEGCVYMDPYAYAWYCASKRQTATPVWTEKDERDERQLVSLIERLKSRAEQLA